MFGYNGYQNNPAVGYQMQVNQNRINQLEQQYNPYQAYQQPVQQTQQQVIKGRPVSSYEEAKASMIDLDGSLFVFPDIANGRIYTKQIMMDGTADFRIYNLVVERNAQGQEEQSGTQEQPAYVVPNPNCCYGNPLGVGYAGYGYNAFNNGCGCNSGCC